MHLTLIEHLVNEFYFTSNVIYAYRVEYSCPCFMLAMRVCLIKSFVLTSPTTHNSSYSFERKLFVEKLQPFFDNISRYHFYQHSMKQRICEYAKTKITGVLVTVNIV